MSVHFATIEDKLLQLDQKYLDQVEAYLEYLMFLQTKELAQKESLDEFLFEPVPENSRIKILRQFKGDALFPEMNTSKYDVYEQ